MLKWHQDTPTQAYAVDDHTVYVRYTNGPAVVNDLNADGAPCETADDLAEFIDELFRQGAFGTEIRAALLADIDA